MIKMNKTIVCPICDKKIVYKGKEKDEAVKEFMAHHNIHCNAKSFILDNGSVKAVIDYV